MNIQRNPESEEVSGLYTTTAHLLTLEDFLSQAQEESENLQSIHSLGERMVRKLVRRNQKSLKKIQSSAQVKTIWTERYWI